MGVSSETSFSCSGPLSGARHTDKQGVSHHHPAVCSSWGWILNSLCSFWSIGDCVIGVQKSSKQSKG